MMRQALKRSSLLWIILLLPGAGICEDLSIPIEWYYGRWPSGHAAEAHLIAGAGKLRFDNGYTAYTYSNGKIRAGFNRFQDFLLVSDDPNNLITADATFGYRPSRNWSISLDSLEYSSETSRGTNPPPNPSSSIFKSKRLNFSASIDWSNKSDVKISPQWQRYMEYVDRTVGEGQWLSRLTMHGVLNARDHATHGIDPTTARSFSSSDSRNTWFFEYSVQGAVSDRWHVSLTVSEHYDYSISNSAELNDRLGLPFLRVTKSAQEFSLPKYELRSIYGLTDDVFLRLSVAQTFKDVNSFGRIVMFELDTILISNQVSERDSPLQETQTSLGGRIDIITKGVFMSGIVLDDYAGYYHQMLFAGQYHGQFEFRYDRNGAAGQRNTERNMVRHSSRYGLTNKINIGGSINYDWRNSGSGWSFLTTALDIQWRSYGYRPESGPGWYRDSPFDIQYGPIKRPGHLFFSVSARPPSWQSHGGQGFLSFGGLRSNKNWGISSSFIAGLPWQSEIRATSSWSLIHNQPNTHLFRMSLAKRLWDKLEFSVDYFNDPPSRLARQAGLADDFELTFNIRGFL